MRWAVQHSPGSGGLGRRRGGGARDIPGRPVCADGGAVAYGPVVRRQDSALPTNTVPALVVGQDGALWLGTALAAR
jgi:hypothetical protein